ncbi:hypothetical protein F4802DRAFT_469005 [Xylaria palmicola]|nr:hypothetical protein F4802DRAFT_469005 [Xylaria palmicola]
MEAPRQPVLCIACNRHAAIFYSICKSAYYCSRECQKADYPTHKLLCADFASIDITTRPAPHHIRAIFFPANQTKPRFVWLPCALDIKVDGDEGRSPGRRPIVETILGPQHALRHEIVQYNSILVRQLSHSLCICHYDDFWFQLNKSVARVTATGPGQYFNWHGNAIVYGSDQPLYRLGKLKDLDMNDFRHITDCLLSNSSNLALPTPPSSDLPSIKAVRINCLGDQVALSRPPFEQVEISVNHPIFTVHDTSDIAEWVGMAIYTRRCAPDPS